MDINESECCQLSNTKEPEEGVHQREKALKAKESAKKQVLLRLAPALWEQIASWAEDDFRSINSQIEYILSEAIKKRFNV